MVWFLGWLALALILAVPVGLWLRRRGKDYPPPTDPPS